jgi:hypothetical protein
MPIGCFTALACDDEINYYSIIIIISFISLLLALLAVVIQSYQQAMGIK